MIFRKWALWSWKSLHRRRKEQRLKEREEWGEREPQPLWRQQREGASGEEPGKGENPSLGHLLWKIPAAPAWLCFRCPGAGSFTRCLWDWGQGVAGTVQIWGGIYSRTLQILSVRFLPGAPVVKDSEFPMQGAQIRSLVWELRSYIPRGMALKKKSHLWWEEGILIWLIYAPKEMLFEEKNIQQLSMEVRVQKTFFFYICLPF